MKEMEGNVQISCGIGLFMRDIFMWINIEYKADQAQLVERKALNLVFMGSSPMVVVD